MAIAHLAAPAPATGSAAEQRPTKSDATLGVGRSLLIKYPLELIDPKFFLSFAGPVVAAAPGDARGEGDIGVGGPELKHWGKFRSVFGRVWGINGVSGSSGSSSGGDGGLSHQGI